MKDLTINTHKAGLTMLIDYSQYDYTPQNSTFSEYYKCRKDDKREATNLSIEDKSKIIEAILMRFLELSFVQMKHFMDNTSKIVYGADIFSTIADFVEDKFAITGGYIDGIQGHKYSEIGRPFQRRIMEYNVHYLWLRYGTEDNKKIMEDVIDIMHRVK